MRFDPTTHTYTNGLHTYKYSATELVEKFKKPFPRDLIAGKVATKEGKSVEEILEKWQLKNEISCDYGDAIHKAVSYYLKYNEEPDQLWLKQVVAEFVKVHKSDRVETEIVVADDEFSVCGTIDLLNITGKKKAIIEDIKTNADLHKKGGGKFLPPLDDLTANKINEYRLQLSIYKDILERKGWTIEGLVLWHYTDHFEKIELEPINLEKVWQTIQSL